MLSACCRAEIAKEEEERLQREEEMKYSNMNKWAAMRMRVLQCSENDIKQQQSQVQAVRKTILFCYVR